MQLFKSSARIAKYIFQSTINIFIFVRCVCTSCTRCCCTEKTANANTNARMEIFTVTMCSLSLISSSLLFLSNLIFYDNDSELSWCVVWPTCDATGRSNQHPNSDWVMKTFAAMLRLIRHVTVAGKFAADDESSRAVTEKPPLSRSHWPSDERPTASLICWHNISVSVHFKVNDYR